MTNERKEALLKDAVDGLESICKAIRNSYPKSGQRYRLVRFLAGLFNGHDFPFNLTNLRGLDSNLCNACLAVLALDSHGAEEIQEWGVVGQEELLQWFKDDGLFD